MMEPTGEMSSEQIGAIEHSIRIGSLLVNDHPEIAELYRDGMTQSRIAEILDVKREYGILSDEVARSSIYRAITGHAGGFGTGPYDGLIPNLDELTRLEHQHRAEYGRISGRKTAAEGKGIHGLTPEQKSEYGRIGGRIGGIKAAESINPETGVRYVVEGGRKAVEDGTGIHGQTPEQKSEYGRIGGRIGGRKAAAEGKGIHGQTPEQKSEYGRIGALAQGRTLWEKEETEYAHLLSLEPEFQHQKGSWKGKRDYKTIAQVLNVDYHNGEEVRSQQAVKINLFKYIKTLGN